MARLLILLALLFIPCHCLADSSGVPLYGFPQYTEWFTKQDLVKESKIKRILYRASGKPNSAYWHRYYPHIGNREYNDCSYYKFCDCRDIRFSRCWQCRDYVYPYVIKY